MNRCRTLGALELTDAGGREHTAVLAQPKRAALLVYLAVANPRGFHRRDTLLALFWPELEQERARAALRQALTFLRHELGDEVIRSRGLEEVGVDPERLWCDVVAFDDALRADDLERALELYQGSLLPGFHVSDCGEFERWLEDQRRELRDRAADAAARLVERAEQAGSIPEATRWARRALELRPDDEEALRTLLVNLDRAGDRACALREYEAFAARLAADYQTRPAPETQQLAMTIRTREGLRHADARAAASAGESTPPTTVRRSISRRARRRVAALPIVALGLASATYAAMRLAGTDSSITTRPPAHRNLLVVAEFENRTADTTLGPTVTGALRIDLAQSPVLRVLDGEALAAVLRRMERDPGTALDPATAQELSQREGAAAYVTGELALLGTGFVLSARVVSATTGEVLIPLRETADNPTQLIAAVDRLSAGLRTRLGEALRTVRASPPLERVTTSSLDALRSYTNARRAFGRGDYVQAIELLEQAIVLDSTFAMAYRLLAPALGNTGVGRSRVVAAARKAFQYRDRLPARERYLTEASFYDVVEPDPEKEIAAHRKVLDLDPDDVTALANLGELYHNTRRYAEAEALFRRVTALRDLAVGYRFLISAQVAQGKFVAAESTLTRFTERLPGSPDALAVRARFSWVRGDVGGAALRLDSLLQAERRTNWGIAALNGLSNLALVNGRLGEAERYRRDAMAAQERRGVFSGYLADAAFLATLALQYYADTGRALREMDAALRRHPLSAIPASDRPYVEIASLYARAGRVSVARRFLAEFEQLADPLPAPQLAGKHFIIGSIALVEGRLLDAVAAFRAYRDEGADLHAGLVALTESFHQLGEIDSALGYVEQFITTPVLRLSDEHARSFVPAYQRLAGLYDQRGRRDKAADAYAKVMALWSRADAELQPAVRAARGRLEALGAPPEQWGPAVPPAPKYARRAIAVLPFRNLSAEPQHAYFAGGLQEEILTQLSKVTGLTVISRTSVMGYAGPSLPPLRQIASELGVGSVVEGSVQVVGGRLRVNVQLTDVATGTNVWAERYDRTVDDAFAIQSDVAHQIVKAVGAALSTGELRALAEMPTVNPEAYRLYLHGRDYFTRPGRGRHNFEMAEQLYERALELDPNFALAHAALSVVLSWTYFVRFDSPARGVRAREEAEAALRLAPDLPEARIAMGAWHYWVRQDYQRALEDFAIAVKRVPNNAWLWQMIAAVHRRLGNWNEVFAAFERATQLNPLDADFIWDLGGNTYSSLGRYGQAVRAYDRALALVPDLHRAAISKGWVYVFWRGDLDTLRAAVRRAPDATEVRVQLLLLERNADSLLRFLRTTPMSVIQSQQFFVPTALYTAWAQRLRGEKEAARAAFGSALLVLDSVTVMSERPDDWRVHVARGLALAGLGRRDEALREARWLRESAGHRTDAATRPFLAIQRARILAQAGEADSVSQELERLNAASSPISAHMLRLDHIWDPIRNHPRFQALLAKLGT